MDVEELDAWLGEDDDGAATGRPPWRATAGRDIGVDRPGRGGRRHAGEEGPGARSKWVRIGLIAGGVWVVVLLVVLGGGGDTTAEDAPLAAVAGQDDGLVARPVDPALQDVGEQPPPGPTAGPAGTTPPQEPATAGGADPPVSGVAESTAILALRDALAAAPDGAARYLEWAIPVDREALGGDLEVVVLDAVWLLGQDGVYDRAERGRWAVPVSVDGALLGQPWAVGTPEAPPTEELPPPVLRERVPEVEAALLAVGWSDVVVQASEPHPDLPAVWRALVDGADPIGVARVGSLVWLVDVDGLRLAGGPR